MISGPALENKEALPYVAIITQVTIPEIPAVLPPLIPKVFNWLQKRDIAPAGPRFFRYLEKNGDTWQVAVGFPVSHPVAGDNQVQAGSFPAGQYAVIRYQGPYTSLFRAHTTLENWIKDLDFLILGQPAEFYITDPGLEPNPENC